MDENSYKKYIAASDNWLHSGRKALIEKVINMHINKQNNLTILDVGAGIGQNVSALAKFGSVDVLEMENLGITELKKRTDIRKIICNKIPCELDCQYDLIGAFDVIEHIENDEEAIQWIYNHLKTGGLFIATVPAYNWLFSNHDRALGHYRRYSAKEFLLLFKENNMQLLSASYFNFFLFPAALIARSIWSIKNRFLNKKNLPEKQSDISSDSWVNKLFLKILLREVNLLSTNIRLPFGLSYYVCFRKV